MTRISSWQHYGIHGVFGWLGFFNGLIAGIHVGEIVIGEVGVLKREIALIGDVMNTSARIAGYCRECAHNLIISSSLNDLLPNKSFYHSLSLGVVNLRGKAEGLELFAISSSNDNHGRN